ncbi:hypothetical protein C8R43DRAFT_1027164, partial [Mycena crocata]
MATIHHHFKLRVQLTFSYVIFPEINGQWIPALPTRLCTFAHINTSMTQVLRQQITLHFELDPFPLPTMQIRRRPRRLFTLKLYGFSPHKRLKGSPTVCLTLDALRTSLDLVKASADICPPLKSAAGVAVALCNLADRVAASDSNAEALAFRAGMIIDTIYDCVDATSPDIPIHLLRRIAQFEQLLTEICIAMQGILKKGRLRRLLHLRLIESELAKFTARLDSAAESFTIGTITAQTVSIARIGDAVEKDTTSSSALQHSNIRLHNEVRFLQLTVIFWT